MTPRQVLFLRKLEEGCVIVPLQPAVGSVAAALAARATVINLRFVTIVIDSGPSRCSRRSLCHVVASAAVIQGHVTVFLTCFQQAEAETRAQFPFAALILTLIECFFTACI